MSLRYKGGVVSTNASLYDPTIDYIIIGGGGGGGSRTGGGGGAGAYIKSSMQIVKGVTYPIIIGGGGSFTGTYLRGGSGTSSYFGPTIAIGGAGGAGEQQGAITGASGGGGCGFPGSASGGSAGTAGLGFAGGNGNTGAGGGGGAGDVGQVGGSGQGTAAGAGGIGKIIDLYPICTSSTAVVIGGSQTLTFTVGTGLPFIANQHVRLYANSNNYMYGIVTSYSGTSLVVDVGDTYWWPGNVVGTGYYTSWTISILMAAGGGGGGGVYFVRGGRSGWGGGGYGGGYATGISAGLDNTGSGGGGKDYAQNAGASGGSGTVIISSPIAASVIQGTYSVVSNGPSSVYTFKSSGSIKF